ncbi:MAG: prepilin-type N-terminal cleavage/methylation domain-containing protein [Motilibacteraceae bacterium]
MTLCESLNCREGQRDEGFTLVETVLAMAITFVVMAVLLVAFVSTLSTVTLSKQRQTATALATHVMEELRALPYATVTAGLKNTDTSGDPNISGSTFSPTVGGISGETLVTYATGADQSPLYPHRTTETVDGVNYTVGTYVTRAGTANPAYNLTVLVSWSSNVTKGATKTVVQRSTSYSPSGCLSSATHPYSGPCQAFFNGQAGLSTAGITVTNDVDSTQPITGLSGLKALLSLPSLTAGVGVEQTTKLNGGAQTTQAAVTYADGTTSSSGGQAVTASADTDPSSTAQTTSSGSTGSQSSGAQTLSGLAGTLAVTPTTGDSGSSGAYAVSTSTGCVNDAGTTINPLGQPCTSGSVQSTGTAGSITLNLSGAAAVKSLPTFSLANVGAAPSASRAYVSRLLSSAGSACPTPSGNGCITSGVTRSLGDVTVGRVPASSPGDNVPAGYDYSFKVSGLAEQVYAESGTGTRSPASAYSRTGGTLSYWNGSGYSTLNLATLTADTTVSTPVVTAYYYNIATLYVSVSVESTITASGKAAAVSTGTSPCQAAACAVSSTGASVLRASTRYVVTLNGLPLTQFVVVTDLGSVLAQSSYQAAPAS